MQIRTRLVILVSALSGCAIKSTAPDPDTTAKIGGAVTAPLEDLNLIRTKIPEVLVEAGKDPYRRLDDANCYSISLAVAALNDALGPDLDTRRVPVQSLLDQGGAIAEETAIDTVRDTTESVLPFRGWIRRLSGAQRHSREVESAIAAGFVRRAYLKGLGESQGCEPPAAPFYPAPAAEQDADSPTETGH